MDLCSITSGSSGNCIYVGSDTTGVLIDAGLSGKKIEEGLNSVDRTLKEIQGILVTHEHSDHIRGIGVLARKYGLPIYATAGTIEGIIQTQATGKIDESLFHRIRADEPFTLGDLNINPIHISHDAAEPVAFRVEHQGKSTAVITDLGNYTDYTVDKLKGLDVLLLEANHDINMLQVGSYPYYLKQRILGDRGHLSNEASGQLLCSLLHDQLKHVFLGHLSKENNFEELAYESVCMEVTMGDNPYRASDFHIQVAKRDQRSDFITF